jgi:hypothetical protein
MWRKKKKKKNSGPGGHPNTASYMGLAVSNSRTYSMILPGIVSTVCNLDVFHTVRAGRHKIFQDLISGDLHLLHPYTVS